MPTTELVLPAGRALYPAFTRLATKPLELKEAYLSSLAALALICWSVGVGLAVVSRDFTLVVLGERWADLAPIVPWASLAASLFALSNTVLTVHQAAGRARTFALQTWLRVALFAPLVFVVAQSGNLEWVVEARFAVTVIWVPLLLVSLRAVIDIGIIDILRANWRPAIAAVVMAAAVLASTAALSALPSYARLCVNVALGAALFICVQIALWLIAGKPSGIERSAIDWLRRRQAQFDLFR
jgi:O-antigen/teichoic acid export membrane protein